MIRPFDLRDFALVRRLRERRTFLHTESALIEHSQPLRGAMTHMLGKRNEPFYVWRANEGGAAGFSQLKLNNRDPLAQLVCLAGETENHQEDDSFFLPLLEQLTEAVGEQGVQGLIAEVHEGSDKLVRLREAGFAIYTRQDVWVLRSVPPNHKGDVLRQREQIDDWDIQLLYANTVPRIVQLAEPTPPLHRGTTWVVRDGRELSVCAHVEEGPAGYWLRMYVHPNTDIQLQDVVAAVAARIAPTEVRPLYCCLRRYQGWMAYALEACGFEHWGRQAVMVKYMVKHVSRSVPNLADMLQKGGVPQTQTSSVSQHVHTHLSPTHDNGRSSS